LISEAMSSTLLSAIESPVKIRGEGNHLRVGSDAQTQRA